MNKSFNKKISIIFLYKKGRKERLNYLNNIPSEFFYGYREFKEEGLSVNFLEELDLNITFKNIYFQKFLNLSSKLFFNLPLNTILGIIFFKGYKKLKKADSIITTTNNLGIAVTLAKKIGLIRSNILFINMGIFYKNPNFLKLFFYKNIFKNIQLLTISKTEYKILNNLLKDIDIKYIPFGVDLSFWYPKLKNKFKPYILSIGNDFARDWDTLIKAWDEDFPNLKIITSLPLRSKKKNIEVIKGNWHFQSLSDLEMRDLYRDSEFVIVPLKETFQPSGQSTCLQAMACSKAVLISDIKGIWDRELLKHKENIFFVKPGDKVELNSAIRLLLKNKKLKGILEKNGRNLVNDHFNIINMKEHLQKYLEAL